MSTFLEIRNLTKELLSSLAKHLPNEIDYVFLDKEKFRKLVVGLNELSARQQEVLVCCIDGAEALIAASVSQGNKPDYRAIYHKVVNHREQDEEKQRILTSLLASIFSMRGIIKKERIGARVTVFTKGCAETESYLLT